MLSQKRKSLRRNSSLQIQRTFLRFQWQVCIEVLEVRCWNLVSCVVAEIHLFLVSSILKFNSVCRCKQGGRHAPVTICSSIKVRQFCKDLSISFCYFGAQLQKCFVKWRHCSNSVLTTYSLYEVGLSNNNQKPKKTRCSPQRYLKLLANK